MAAARDALTHAFGVKLDILETGKPDVHGEPLACRTLEKFSHGPAAEGGLEGEVEMPVDRALEKRSTLTPSGCVDLAHCRRWMQVRIGGQDLARGLVRVVEAHPSLEQSRPPDAAFASSVAAGEHEDAAVTLRRRCRLSHAYGVWFSWRRYSTVVITFRGELVSAGILHPRASQFSAVAR